VTNLLTGIGKALIGYWVGIIAVLFLPASIGAFGIFIFGATVSIGVGVLLNLGDDEFDWTLSLQKKINELQETFNKKINSIEKDIDNALYNFYDHFR